jgi:protein-S-isoprenylcysteine O-methyltransferase Ste14
MNRISDHLIQFMWIAWGAYWYISSFSASAPKRVQSAGKRLSYRVEMLVAAAFLAFPQLSFGWLGYGILPRSRALYWLAVAVVATGLGFAVWARVHLGEYWSGHVTLKPGHRLIRTGPYSIVRHPIYTGILLGFVGTALAVDNVAALLSIAILLHATIPKMRLEEKWLTEEFGEEYQRYRREVKALVPFVV